MPSDDTQIILYQPDESIRLEVKVDIEKQTVWLTQQQIAELFGVKQPAISKHLSNIFKEASWKNLQFIPFWNILPPMVRSIRRSSTISTL